ncbi:hypothetical protein DY000_02054652 [Brassica cretica]|uniref:Uncharacterized protein n=1 Tax=Brassica cretica TaxID=69181 RepID=A0ABQ7AC32_BRACR|nr:hypothetical protein DY000_02054652 [Brassica cretica]
MNFTSQKFLSPSICEYPTLEEDSSSIKEWPEAKTIIGVKRSLSALQKAQYQEKWPRKLGVMINSPEPAKPSSSMESLQPIQLGSTQSYLWEPGDHLNQSGAFESSPLRLAPHRHFWLAMPSLKGEEYAITALSEKVCGEGDRLGSFVCDKKERLL